MAALSDLTQAQQGALIRFKENNGRYWKTELSWAWSRDPTTDDGRLLRQIRNEFGPEWLLRLKELK